MKQWHVPAFGYASVSEHQENRTARVLAYEGADAAAFDACCRQLAADGYTLRDAFSQDAHRFAAFACGGCAVMINHYGSTGEMRIVEEEDCAWLTHEDRPRNACVQPQITQLALEDFGMSYVIRLPDGRMIVIDGGRNLPPESDKLYRCLRSQSPLEKPVIAAWILSHPHPDHFLCFLGFMDKYAQEVEIESFLFNFPEADDLAHYPALANSSVTPVGDQSSVFNIPRMLAWVRKTGARVYQPHTGQRYSIGGAQLEILSCMDDTLHLSQNINASALVVRMELGGQVILWSTDAAFSIARLAQRYGRRLRADILQIPHHGFQSGAAEGELAAYAFIQPKVCFLPASDFTAYTFFCAYRPGTRSLMESDGVEELITGEHERTIALPYTAPEGAMERIHAQMRQGQDCAGARAWFFTGLSTANPEDFVFTLLNTVIPDARVRIDLYFEQKAFAVREIYTEVGGSRFRQLHITDDVEDNAVPFSEVTLRARGVPENQPFAVRFLSDVPIVVSHRTHRAVYHSVT